MNSSVIFSKYNFVRYWMFPKLASVVAIGTRLFKLDIVITIGIGLSWRSCRRPNITKKIEKTATFVRRDLLAAFLYFSFASSASFDGEYSGLWGSWLMFAGTSAYCNLCQTLQIVVNSSLPSISVSIQSLKYMYITMSLRVIFTI